MKLYFFYLFIATLDEKQLSCKCNQATQGWTDRPLPMFSIYDRYLETALFLIVSADRACKMVGTAWSLLVVYTHKTGCKTASYPSNKKQMTIKCHFMWQNELLAVMWSVSVLHKRYRSKFKLSKCTMFQVIGLNKMLLPILLKIKCLGFYYASYCHQCFSAHFINYITQINSCSCKAN